MVLLAGSPGRADAVENPFERPEAVQLVDVQKIWDRGVHNAFCDIIRFQGDWFVALRESPTIQHVPAPPGEPAAKGVLIRSQDDGRTWQEVRLFDYGSNWSECVNNLEISPDGRLMIAGTAASQLTWKTQPFAAFTSDGQNFTAIQDAGPFHTILYDIVLGPDNRYYSISYGSHLALLNSVDGVNYSFVKDGLLGQECPTEAALLFRDKDNSAVALFRNDCESMGAFIGTSSGALTDWNWCNSGTRAEGPRLIELPDNRIVAAVRLYDPTYGFRKTSLCWLDPKGGTLNEFLQLPSAGDTSYAGLVWHDNLLWISYYSTHEGRTSIYLAKVRIRQALYREIFSSGGSHQSLNLAHWKLNRGTTGSSSTSGLIYRQGGGEVPLGGSVHSNPSLPDDTDGYVYCSGAGSGVPNLFWTEEHTIPRHEADNLWISWQTDHDSTVEPMRAALRLDNNWYVSEPLFITGATGWGDEGRVLINVSASEWRRLHFSPGVELGTGDVERLSPYGTITAFGWYNDGQIGNLRFDNFQIIDAPWQCRETLLTDYQQNCWLDLADLLAFSAGWLNCTAPGCESN